MPDLFSHCIREHDLLARLGGDEFVILLTHLTELQQAEDVADRIINIMKKPFCSKGTCIQSGASIGITYSNSSYQHTDEIIRDAVPPTINTNTNKCRISSTAPS